MSLLRRTPTRRTLLAFALAAPAAAFAGCAADEDDGPTLALDAPLPAEVPAGTKLIAGDPATKVALELSGEIDTFSFEVEWANLSGGPQTSEAFRADALDVGSVAEIPSINATWTNLPVKNIAAKFRKDPLNHPTYEIGIAPGAGVTSLDGLRGKKVAYSPGQAQGALVLRILAGVGLSREDVELVELASTGDVYPNALVAGEVDAAPIGGVNIKRYLNNYAKDGAITLRHGQRDDPLHLYTRVETLENAAKAAALREFVEVWARAQIWIHEHPEEWIQGYYVTDQGLSEEDGRYLVELAGEPDLPADWSEAIARNQETIDLLAEATGNDPFPSEDLYDRRFEPVQYDAIQDLVKAAG